MGGKASRLKGHNFERAVAKMLREVMPGAEFKRGLQSRGGGAEEADVFCSAIPLGKKEFPFHVECKIGKLPNPRAALKQAKEDAKEGMVPLAVVKDDREAAFVVMDANDFFRFIKEWWE